MKSHIDCQIISLNNNCLHGELLTILGQVKSCAHRGVMSLLVKDWENSHKILNAVPLWPVGYRLYFFSFGLFYLLYVLCRDHVLLHTIHMYMCLWVQTYLSNLSIISQSNQRDMDRT